MREKRVDTTINKKKKKHKLLFTICQIIIGILAGYFIIYGLGKDIGISKEVMAYTFFKIIITIYIALFLQINIHEFGHFVMGKMLGYRLLFYQIGFLSWRDKNGKMTFEIKKNKGYSGACSMLPPKEGFSSKYQLWYFSGGILFNLLSLIPIFLIMYTVNNNTVLVLGRTVIIITLFLIGMNAMPICIGTQPSDGKIIFRTLFKSPMSSYIIENTNIAASMSQGIRPRDLDIKDFEDGILESIDSVILLQLVVMRYFKALDSMDLPNIKRYIKVMQENVQQSPSYIQPGIYYELIYYYCVIEFSLDQANKYFDCAKKTLLKDNDVNGKRVLAVYEYYIKGNKEKAMACCEEGLKVVDKYPLKGQALMEKKLIEELIQKGL